MRLGKQYSFLLILLVAEKLLGAINSRFEELQQQVDIVNATKLVKSRMKQLLSFRTDQCWSRMSEEALKVGSAFRNAQKRVLNPRDG